MQIYDSSEKNLWAAAGISPEKGIVLSVVGAGGKSSLIRHLSDELNRRKIQHYIGTTTHMWPMDAGLYGKQIGQKDSDGKITSPDEAVWQHVFSEGYPVLIEADGSKGLPCKVPEIWEPVFRKETTHVFGVLGMTCLDQTISKVCHRPEKAAQLLKCTRNHRITVDDVRMILKSSEGLRKNIEDGWKYYVILNQVDDSAIYERVKQIKEEAKNLGIDGLWFTQMLN